jgi:thymidylate synthase
MKDGFPLLTTKKMAFKTMVTELLWFLRGDTSIEYLLENDCNIWTGDAYKNYTKYPLATIHDHHTNILYQNRDKGWCMLNGRSMVSPHPTRHLTQEEFINKIKTDDEFAKKWGELGPIYGKQWRSWGSNIIDELGNVYTNEVDYDIQNGKLPNGSSNRKFVIDELKKYNPRIDQIANLINDLKTNPDSRRLMVNAWNVGELDQMVLPPCHYGFQVYTRELSQDERYDLLTQQMTKLRAIRDEDYINYNIPTRAISLMWNQRSVDTGLGLGFNIASYGLLLEIISKEVNMVPDELIGNLGDVHLYLDHIEPIKEQLTREPYPLPTLRIKQHSNDEPSAVTKPQYWHPEDFVIENYQYHPTIKLPLSN